MVNRQVGGNAEKQFLRGGEGGRSRYNCLNYEKGGYLPNY